MKTITQQLREENAQLRKSLDEARVKYQDLYLKNEELKRRLAHELNNRYNRGDHIC